MDAVFREDKSGAVFKTNHKQHVQKEKGEKNTHTQFITSHSVSGWDIRFPFSPPVYFQGSAGESIFPKPVFTWPVCKVITVISRHQTVHFSIFNPNKLAGTLASVFYSHGIECRMNEVATCTLPYLTSEPAAFFFPHKWTINNVAWQTLEDDRGARWLMMFFFHRRRLIISFNSLLNHFLDERNRQQAATLLAPDSRAALLNNELSVYMLEFWDLFIYSVLLLLWTDFYRVLHLTVFGFLVFF